MWCSVVWARKKFTHHILFINVTFGSFVFPFFFFLFCTRYTSSGRLRFMCAKIYRLKFISSMQCADLMHRIPSDVRVCMLILVESKMRLTFCNNQKYACKKCHKCSTHVYIDHSMFLSLIPRVDKNLHSSWMNSLIFSILFLLLKASIFSWVFIFKAKFPDSRRTTRLN